MPPAAINFEPPSYNAIPTDRSVSEPAALPHSRTVSRKELPETYKPTNTSFQNPPASQSSRRTANAYAYKPKASVKDIFSEDDHSNRALQANISRRRDVPTSRDLSTSTEPNHHPPNITGSSSTGQVQQPAPQGFHERSKTVGTIDSSEDSYSTPVTASTDFQFNSASTAITSAAYSPPQHSKSNSQHLNRDTSTTTKADVAAQQWMKMEFDKRRRQSEDQQCAEMAPLAPVSTKRSFTAELKEYIRPRPSIDSRPSVTRTKSSDSLGGSSNYSSGLPRSTPSHGWRSWSLQRKLSKENLFGSKSRDAKDSLDLNRPLPALPSLDTWKEPEKEPERKHGKKHGKNPSMANHIATLMRPTDKNHDLTINRAERPETAANSKAVRQDSQQTVNTVQVKSAVTSARLATSAGKENTIPLQGTSSSKPSTTYSTATNEEDLSVVSFFRSPTNSTTRSAHRPSTSHHHNNHDRDTQVSASNSKLSSLHQSFHSAASNTRIDRPSTSGDSMARPRRDTASSRPTTSHTHATSTHGPEYSLVRSSRNASVDSLDIVSLRHRQRQLQHRQDRRQHHQHQQTRSDDQASVPRSIPTSSSSKRAFLKSRDGNGIGSAAGTVTTLPSVASPGSAGGGGSGGGLAGLTKRMFSGLSSAAAGKGGGGGKKKGGGGREMGWMERIEREGVTGGVLVVDEGVGSAAKMVR